MVPSAPGAKQANAAPHFPVSFRVKNASHPGGSVFSYDHAVSSGYEIALRAAGAVVADLDEEGRD